MHSWKRYRRLGRLSYFAASTFTAAKVCAYHRSPLPQPHPHRTRKFMSPGCPRTQFVPCRPRRRHTYRERNGKKVPRAKLKRIFHRSQHIRLHLVCQARRNSLSAAPQHNRTRQRPIESTRHVDLYFHRFTYSIPRLFFP